MGNALNDQLIFATRVPQVEEMPVLLNRLAANAEDKGARFDLSIRQLAQYQYDEAIDNLFIIHQQDEDYKKGAAKEMLINLSNMLAPVNNEQSQDIRRRLGIFCLRRVLLSTL